MRGIKTATLAFAAYLFCAPVFAGVTIDGNGWSVITPSSTGFCEGISCTPTGGASGTRIVYAAQSGCDFNGTTCTNDGSFSQPTKTAHFAVSKLRGGSPDWVLFKCGDTWTNDAPDLNAFIPGGNASGVDQQTPMLVSNYDSNAGHNPPIPDPSSCSARPQFNLDHNYANSCFSGSNFVAFLGIKCYAPGRDPNNSTISPTFNTTDKNFNQASALFFHSTGSVLIEDVYMGFFGGGPSFATTFYPPWSSPVLFRRNQIVGNYPVGQENSGLLLSTNNTSDPANYVLYQNVIDNNGWMAAAGVGASGFNHNVYVPSQNINGDPASAGGPVTLDGNILTNDGSAPALRATGIYINNLLMHNPRGLPILQPQNFSGQISNNVILDGVTTAAAPGATGIEIQSRYINEAMNAGHSIVAGNIIANGPGDPNAQGIFFDSAGGAHSGPTGNSVTGNYIYNWGYNTPSNALEYDTGGVCGGTITAGGTGYTDLSTPILSAAASTDGQNYVVLQVTNATSILPIPGIVYSTSGNLTGAYQASVLDSTHIVLYGSTFSTSFTGTLFYAYYQTSLTGGTGTGFQQDLISVGGAIVANYLYGSDYPYPSPTEHENNPGKGYTVNDVLTSAISGGSGYHYRVDTLCTNTTSPNNLDPTGSNSANWPDPNRTPGAYYATLAGSTANATFTGVISGGVVTVSGISGTLNLGDAITWTGQSKSEYIKGNASTGSSLCSPACTGSGGNGTYAVAGTETVGSIAMKSYATQQLIALMDNQSKGTWNTALTASAVNSFIQAGFGISAAPSWASFTVHQ